MKKIIENILNDDTELKNLIIKRLIDTYTSSIIENKIAKEIENKVLDSIPEDKNKIDLSSFNSEAFLEESYI